MKLVPTPGRQQSSKNLWVNCRRRRWWWAELAQQLPREEGEEEEGVLLRQHWGQLRCSEVFNAPSLPLYNMHLLYIFFHILAGQWRTVVEAWEARWQVWASWRAAQGRGERVRGDPCCHEWGREGEREALVRKWRWRFLRGVLLLPQFRNWLLRSGLILSWFVWIWTFGLPWSGKCD